MVHAPVIPVAPREPGEPSGDVRPGDLSPNRRPGGCGNFIQRSLGLLVMWQTQWSREILVLPYNPGGGNFNPELARSVCAAITLRLRLTMKQQPTPQNKQMV